ncbi:hypothetical protein APE_0898.1 [Aeropyrum pernix K1]|uniref:Uncharacterized protein n=1 Tax=Aeropyrum pernix (strain ATCC 700893 / DSM 11879 / JCM 9820 / NBRC 100138 / K1) TaxID=272557 RepID=Q9YDL5_AERPE|nr:hypothetical protein [Aeropyrum pernix]BAA79882.2 hypothetical protein APE_0898.1 [Aeropyrum pernix K1]
MARKISSAPMRGKARRGQAEVIGGLIIITILLVFLLPLALQSIRDVVDVGSKAREAEVRVDVKLKEELAIRGATQEEMGSTDYWPAVWIENTGTVPVTLRYMFLLHKSTGEPLSIIDMSRARPGNPGMIKYMFLNPVMTSEGPKDGEPLPPTGEYISLAPGDKLLVVFDSTKLPASPFQIRIRVLSAEGVLHPKTGGYGQGDLVPQAPGEAGVSGEEGGLTGETIAIWKGAFTPYAGFKLIGGEELKSKGSLRAFIPQLVMDKDLGVTFESAAVYSDPDYPGLYKVVLIPGSSESFTLHLYSKSNSGSLSKVSTITCSFSGGDYVEFRGFIGTFHIYSSGGGEQKSVMLHGHATDILVNGTSCVNGPYGLIDISDIVVDSTSEVSDFDSNGITELVLYSYKNGPNYTPTDVNADGLDIHGTSSCDLGGVSSSAKGGGKGGGGGGGGSGSSEGDDCVDDALVWSYVVTRDITNQDFIRVTVKVNYYWTRVPEDISTLPTRKLRIFSVAVWEYNDDADKWILKHLRDIGFDEELPKQFKFTTIFPIERDKKYRVGILFYDSYRQVGRSGTNATFFDFTYGLEYLIVEYGRFNPLFSSTPPIYIVAIRDESKISGLGGDGTSELEAQDLLLDKIKSLLEAQGLVDYVVIRDAKELCSLLLDQSLNQLPAGPPEGAIVIWLQGEADPVTVTSGVCSQAVSSSDLKARLIYNHWIFVQPAGTPLFGSESVLQDASSGKVLLAGPGTAQITPSGLEAQVDFGAYNMPSEAEFQYLLDVVNPDCVVDEGTFYQNTDTGYYGTLAFWADCQQPGSVELFGIFIVNPASIDWGYNGGGLIPEAVAEITVFSALKTYKEVLEQLLNTQGQS